MGVLGDDEGAKLCEGGISVPVTGEGYRRASKIPRLALRTERRSKIDRSDRCTPGLETKRRFLVGRVDPLSIPGKAQGTMHWSDVSHSTLVLWYLLVPLEDREPMLSFPRGKYAEFRSLPRVSVPWTARYALIKCCPKCSLDQVADARELSTLFRGREVAACPAQAWVLRNKLARVRGKE